MQPAYQQPTRQVPVPPRARRPAKRRGCMGCGLLALFLVIMIPVFICGLTLVLYLALPPQPMDILVLGLDARPGEGMVTRTDSIMLVGLQPSRLRVSILSIPRDLFLDVPNYGYQRINAVNVLGEMDQEGSGPTLLAAAIGQNFGIGIDRYVRLDFQGFKDLIDAVGGVTIEVERTIVDNAYPTEDGGTINVRFDPGVEHMNGERALIYARTRHSDDDYQRADRQQQVLSALSLKLINPLTWPAVFAVFSRSVDTNLTPWDMLTQAPTIILNAGRFEREVIDRDLISANANGQAIPDYAELSPWLSERFN